MASRAASPATELVVGDRTVRISNPDRVYFSDPNVTKLDIAKYYLAVGEGIVRALRERPCMLHRFPEGIAGEKVYQKRLPRGAPDWVQTVEVKFPSGRTADELCVTELASVIWAVQMSTVEFHPWHSRRADTESPDELRIDLDPQPGTGLAEAKRVGAVVHEVLDGLGWAGWPKTSGNRGLHIYVRIRPDWTFTQVRRAALAFAREVERRVPELATTKWWKEERGEKVFVDFNQNARDRTIASAYSLRGQPGALVSTPITGPSCPTSRAPTSPSGPCRSASPTSVTCTPGSTTPRSASSRCWSGRSGTSGTMTWEMPPTRPIIQRWKGNRCGSNRAGRRSHPAAEPRAV